MSKVRSGLLMIHLATWPGGRLALAVLLALSLVILIPGAQPAKAGGWAVQCLDCPKDLAHMKDRSLQLDAANHPHVAYGGDHLYYAWHDGVGWRHETVDGSTSVGWYASLALDGDGHAHVAYYDYQNDRLKYAMRDATGWHVEVVAVDGGAYASLAVDDQGYPHIAYQDSSSEGLRYAYQDATGWHHEGVSTDGDGAEAISLALNQDGSPSMSYRTIAGDYLRYTYPGTFDWEYEMVGDSDWGNTSLAVNGDGYAHISYLLNNRLQYAYQDASGWHTETVPGPGTGSEGGESSLALDLNGWPHISYEWASSYVLQEVKHAYRDAAGWHTEVVTAGDYGEYTSLAVDGNGYGHITYRDYDTADLKYAYQDASGWHVEVADEGGRAGASASLVVDADDRVHVSYLDHYDLGYARQLVSGWQFESVDSNVEAFDISLALDQTGVPHIAYCDHRTLDLKFAYLDVSGWHTETVSTSPGHGISLAVNGDGYAHMSYCVTDSGGQLEYAYQGAAGWQIEVAAADVAQARTSLILDASGYPHIAYYGAGGSQLRHVYKDETGWHGETIDTGTYAQSDWDVSMAMDANGHLHVSYFKGMLNYAYQGDLGWQPETVDADGGPYHSLALDGAGLPRIAYYNTSQEGLSYAYKDAAGWHLQTVDNVGSAVQFPSMAIDTKGRPHIAYQDLWNGDVKYAYAFTGDNWIYLPLVFK